MQKQPLNKSRSVAGAQRFPVSPLWRLLRPIENASLETVDPVTLRSFSFNTGADTDLSEQLFEAEQMASARKIAAERSGVWIAPAGECRATITWCGRSALISLEQVSCKKALGISVVTWSEDLAPFAWGELLRAYVDSARSREARPFDFDGGVFPSGCLPRMGTLIWPAIAKRLDEQGLFLAEATFWSLGLALLPEGALRKRHHLKHGTANLYTEIK
jgi:hypothetical protein